MKEIKLTQRKVALVDDEDYEYLNQWKWCTAKIANTYYVTRRQKLGNGLSMHRLIMNTPKGMEVDHIDHNGLNNQKHNLRNCTHQQNTMNRACTGEVKYRGVSKISPNQKHVLKNGEVKIYINSLFYKAYIRINGKLTFLGKYKTAEEAAVVYNNAAIKYYKEFANLNIIKT